MVHVSNRNVGGSGLVRQVWKDAVTREARPQTWSTQKPEIKAGPVLDGPVVR